ncbi:MAG: 16S rRNA (uracil(1498)-N(3))-methyltransferase [Candidatus Omnitrophica bacterium]|nr:16S rRNA (uracil(1498)-N(3))-methyltransferase [Candidatus Omnitrophota bacterium]
MVRVLVPPDAVARDRITVSDPAQVHHLLHVLRIRPGDPLECFDGAGRRYAGRVLQRRRQAVIVSIESQDTAPASRARLILVQALIKPEPFAWVVQKATELGVERVAPLVTARTTARPVADRLERQVERWRRISRAAARQCGRQDVPLIEPPRPFGQLVPAVAQHARLIMPTLAVPAVPLREGLEGCRGAEAVAALIGPEGDFTPEEAALAQRHGARAVSLGRLTLRSETAAVATLAVLRYAIDT